MKQSTIDSTQYNMVVNEVCGKSLSLDPDDVRLVLTGTSGVRYQMEKEDGVSVTDFISSFVDELKSYDQAMQSSVFLIHVTAHNEAVLTMDDLQFLSECFDAFGPEDKMVLWGSDVDAARTQLSMTVFCMKEVVENE